MNFKPDKREIKENIARIKAGISAEKYPVLSGYLSNKRSSLKPHLLFMLEYMAANKAVTIFGGLRYWARRQNDLIKDHGGTTEAWQSHLVFLSLSGLLLRVKPNGQTKNDAMAAAYQRAIEAGKDVEIFYSALPYTAARMAQIEAQARRFKARGVSIGHIRETDIIALYGLETAHLFYQNMRTISTEDEEAAQLIIAAINEQIAARGYAIKAEAVKAAARGAWEREALYQKIQHQAAQLTGLCQDHGLIYRRAKGGECKAWGLNCGAKIILPAEI